MFELVVGAIILDDKGYMLLTKRAKKPEQNKWALVGGKVEPKEILAEQNISWDHRQILLDYLKNN